MQSKKPVKRKDPLEDPDFKSFVEKAEIPTPLSVKEQQTPLKKDFDLPWLGQEYSKKLKPFMNFSLDEEYILKLRWVSKHLNQGQQEIIRSLLRPYLDSIINVS